MREETKNQIDNIIREAFNECACYGNIVDNVIEKIIAIVESDE